MTIRLDRSRGRRAEAVIALAILSLASVGAAWLWLKLPTPACLFHSLTGLPCVTCGGTRCLRDLISGDLGGAAVWNPLVFAGVMLVAVFFLYAAAVGFFGMPRVKIGDITPRDRRVFRGAIVCVAVANWAYLFFRFSGGA